MRHSPVRDYLINLAAASILQLSDHCSPLLQSVGSSPAPTCNDCVDSLLHLQIGFSDMPAKYLYYFFRPFLHQKWCFTLQHHCSAAYILVFIYYCANTSTFWLLSWNKLTFSYTKWKHVHGNGVLRVLQHSLQTRGRYKYLLVLPQLMYYLKIWCAF